VHLLRARLLIVSAAFAAAMIACSGEPTAPPQLAQFYSLLRVNGQAVPVFVNSILIGSENCRFDVLGGDAFFNPSTRRYNVYVSGTTTCGSATAQPFNVVNHGIYDLLGSEIRWSPNAGIHSLILQSGELRNGRVMMQAETHGQPMQLEFQPRPLEF
jgi:hypothetical protein